MKRETQEALLRAYRTAIQAGQNEIADTLEDVILAEMGLSEVKVPVMRDIKTGDGEQQIKLPWNVTCEPPGVTLLGAKMECMGIDHLSKEVTV